MPARDKQADSCGGSLFLLIVGVLVVFGLGFAIDEEQRQRRRERANKPEKYDISRVIMHEPHRYTVFRSDNNEMKPESFCEDGRYLLDIKIIHDVPAEQAMYLQKENGIVEIHIHSPQDLNAGDWKRQDGKRTKTGASTVLE